MNYFQSWWSAIFNSDASKTQVAESHCSFFWLLGNLKLHKPLIFISSVYRLFVCLFARFIVRLVGVSLFRHSFLFFLNLSSTLFILFSLSHLYKLSPFFCHRSKSITRCTISNPSDFIFKNQTIIW